MLALACSGFGMCLGGDETQVSKDVPPLLTGDLTPQLDGREITVKFAITGYQGVAQRGKKGQAPTFIIEADRGAGKPYLNIWIQGELANVLDRLQMAYLQENSLKTGTNVIATGKLTADTKEPLSYELSVTQWQNFRVLPSAAQRP